MTMPAADRKRLAELREQWLRCRRAQPGEQLHTAERLAEIETEAAEIKALHLLRTELGAVVLHSTGTENPR